MEHRDSSESFYSQKQTAKYLNVSEAALRKWRREKRGPRWARFGRLVRYAAQDLNNWVSGNTREC
jgi:excisionase family DNA binding protein